MDPHPDSEFHGKSSRTFYWRGSAGVAPASVGVLLKRNATGLHRHRKHPHFGSMTSDQRNDEIQIPHKASPPCCGGDLVAKLPYNWRGYARLHGDIPSEHTRAELLRRSFLLFALESASRSHAHIHTRLSAHIHSLSAFFTLLHQSVPKLFPHFGEFPRLIPWHKWILGLITLAWTHQRCPVSAKRVHSKTRLPFSSPQWASQGNKDVR